MSCTNLPDPPQLVLSDLAPGPSRPTYANILLSPPTTTSGIGNLASNYYGSNCQDNKQDAQTDRDTKQDFLNPAPGSKDTTRICAG